jgi:putative membrane protein
MSAATVSAIVPYCGPPPDPAAIWSTWRLDPLVLGVLFACWGLYLLGYVRQRRAQAPGAPDRRRCILFNVGWLIATLALVSPLCPLSVSLFAARASQHVLLTLIAAPLVAAGLPLRTLLSGVGASAADLAPLRRWRGTPLPASALFAVLIWIWHMPAPYAWTFASVAAYWSMHVTLFASALWLWSSLFEDARHGLLAGLLASVGSAIQMGLLGALITLSPRPFYVPHFLTTEAWGYSPLQDQQLGGVIMWVVGCTAFFAVAMIGIAGSLGERLPQRALVPAPAASLRNPLRS